MPPHGVDELTQPEAGFFIVGSKSYGRAPTFLMATGYEQVRSIVAELAGDHVAARQVHLVLPETGVCNVAPAAAGGIELLRRPGSHRDLVAASPTRWPRPKARPDAAAAPRRPPRSPNWPRSMSARTPAGAIWALGATQIVGYGTLYYSFAVLAPEIGREFGWPAEWTYGALTIALLAGGFFAPLAGYLADRYGAARTMAFGSLATSLTLAGAALATSGLVYAAFLVAMEVASGFVLYATAFAVLVQAGGHGAQRSITHLTLIAGFASTLFWPLTAYLLTVMDWHAVYMVFAALNLLVCAPLHHRLHLSKLSQPADAPPQETGSPAPMTGALMGSNRSIGFGLMMVGFAIEGFILSAVLMQIIPLLTGLGLGAGTLLVTSLFGPAQVLSRLTNMLLGRNLLSTRVAIIAAVLLPLGAAVLALTAPSLTGAVIFAVLFGLGSGLISIVSGALPLQLLGRDGYGTKLGWLSSARQIASAIAPFCLALMMGIFGVAGALWAIASLGIASVATFAAIALLPRGATGKTALRANYGDRVADATSAGPATPSPAAGAGR